MNVVPPGGWHVVERGVKLEASSREDLIKELAAYRSNNGIAEGFPQEDVDNFICKEFPHLCHTGQVQGIADDDRPQLAYGQPVKKKLVERVHQWAANRYSRLGALDTVDAEEAERRTSICISCPQNIKTWKQDAIKDCIPCRERIQNLESLIFKIKKGNATSRDKSLGACAASGQSNECAIWLTEEGLRHRRHYELPQICWMRELKDTAASSTS